MKKYPLIWKGLVAVVVFLFVGTCVIPTTAQDTKKPSQPSSKGNWWYVGGSGPGNYSKIQDAVDNASDGDTVFVYSGIYRQGNIRVNKTINLRGEDKDTTVVDGCGQTYVFYLHEADFGELFIELSGFTIQNASQSGIFCYSFNNTISGNIILNNKIGIALAWGGNNLIYGNLIRKNSYGIFTLGSHVWDNKIERNVIEDNTWGLDIKDAARNTLVCYNSITNNSGYGLVVNCCSNTVVEKNNIFGNNQNAIFTILGFPQFSESKTNWRKNYWGTPLRHKIIYGKLRIYSPFQPIPNEEQYIYFNWLNFDWRPAQEPYYTW